MAWPDPHHPAPARGLAGTPAVQEAAGVWKLVTASGSITLTDPQTIGDLDAFAAAWEAADRACARIRPEQGGTPA